MIKFDPSYFFDGVTISSGFTNLSKSSPLIYPKVIIASRSDELSVYAFFATSAALSYQIWEFKAVISIRELYRFVSIFSLFASIPSTQLTLNELIASLNIRIDCKIL